MRRSCGFRDRWSPRDGRLLTLTHSHVVVVVVVLLDVIAVVDDVVVLVVMVAAAVSADGTPDPDAHVIGTLVDPVTVLKDSGTTTGAGEEDEGERFAADISDYLETESDQEE